MTTRLTREESRRRTRTLLLDAAERVFARRGYRGASVDEIAEEAGFSKGAVYSNFANKEELFLGLLDRRRVGHAASADGAARTRDGLARLAAPADPEAWEWGLLTLEFFLYAAREPTVRERLAAAFEDQRVELARLLGEGRRPGAPVFSPRDLATVALALGTGLGVQAVLDPAAIPPDLYARVVEALRRHADEP